MAEKSIKESRRITFGEVSKETGVGRTTLSKMAGEKPYNTTIGNLDALCTYFACSLSEYFLVGFSMSKCSK